MILQLSHCTITMNQNGRELCRDLSFVLNEGDKIALIGEEGNGKSTLLKLLCDEAFIASYASYTGELVRRGAIGYLPQFLPEEDGSKTVAEYFAEENIYADGKAVELGLDYALLHGERTLDTLSGGERVKVQLLKLLLRNPDALLLDEPSNDLDLETILFLEEFIVNTPLAVLFISHDETFLERTASGVLHMEQLIKKTCPNITVAKNMTYSDYLERRNLLFGKQTQIALKEREEHRRRMERWQRIYEKTKYQQATITRSDPHGGRLLKKKMKSVKAQQARFERERENMTEIPDREESIITFFDERSILPAGKRVLDCAFDSLTVGGRVLSKHIRLTVYGAKHVCIIGKNGVGKSTLLKRILDELNGRTDIVVAYMPQNYDEVLDGSLSPDAFLGAQFDQRTKTKAMTFLGNMKFTPDEMKRPINSLSGGQKAKLLFLSMVLKGANVLILDEPTRNFSPLSAPVVRKALKEFGGCILSVSHDRKYIDEVADEVYALTQEGLEKIEE